MHKPRLRVFFYWEPFQKHPTFWAPEGVQDPVEAEGYCPYLVEDVQDLVGLDSFAPAAPATAAKSSSDSSVVGNAGAIIAVADVAGDSSAAEPAAPEEAVEAPEEEVVDVVETAKDHAFTHRVFDSKCRACVRGRAQRTPRRRAKLALGERPLQFGQQCTGDHIISRKAA